MDVGELLVSQPKGKERATLVLAHGAGAPMDHPWLTDVAEALAANGLRVVRFEFPYMRLRRERGIRPGPDAPAVLQDTWLAVIHELGGGAGLVIGGKSLGGRIASMIADEAGARGLVCLGYPFHPPGKPGQLRTAHLAELRTPALIVQGERDPFGTREEVETYRLSESVRIEWIPDGDHSLKPRKSSGRSEKQNLAQGVAAVTEFVLSLR
ncbi:MAG TPA: alpha/beta family hydrolase [Candidatus Xenobia bacterium]|nr:alpha/beta family hydrolase [Candidatus Xenobia bacterium]